VTTPDERATADFHLRLQVVCADPAREDLNVRTPDIDDGGDLIRGNELIHPPLDETCAP